MSLPTTEPPGKGMWIPEHDYAVLRDADEAGNRARDGLPEEQGARAAAAAQAEILRNVSWRARFLALAAALLQPHLTHPETLAGSIIRAAPSSRAPTTIPDSDALAQYRGAATRLFDRAAAAAETGALSVTLAVDEARELAITILDVCEGLQELAR